MLHNILPLVLLFFPLSTRVESFVSVSPPTIPPPAMQHFCPLFDSKAQPIIILSLLKKPSDPPVPVQQWIAVASLCDMVVSVKDLLMLFTISLLKKLSSLSSEDRWQDGEFGDSG